MQTTIFFAGWKKGVWMKNGATIGRMEPEKVIRAA